MELFQKCDKDVDMLGVDYTFRYLQDQGMLNQQIRIEEFSKRVERQYALEKKYNEMLENLKQIRVNTLKYKKTFILASIDDLV